MIFSQCNFARAASVAIAYFYGRNVKFFPTLFFLAMPFDDPVDMRAGASVQYNSRKSATNPLI